MTVIAGRDIDGQWREKISPDATSGSLPAIANFRYLSPTGSDAGDGSISAPFATIQAALASITDASPTKRYAVILTGTILGTGDPETDYVLMPANVFIVGTSSQQARISSTQWVFGFTPDWAGDGDNRSGFVGVGVAGRVNINFREQAASAGKVYLVNSWVLDLVDSRAHTLTNQYILNGSQFFGDLQLRGGQLESTSCVFDAGVSLTGTEEAPYVAASLVSVGDLFKQSINLDNSYGAPATTATFAGSSMPQLIMQGAIACKSSITPQAPDVIGATATYESTSTPRSTGPNGRSFYSGIGSPEDVVRGSPGDIYTNAAGGAGVTLWIKETGTGNFTGWVAK